MKEFITTHVHSLFASVTGAGSSLLLPIEGYLAKIVVGIAIGVGTWICTKLLERLKLFNRS